MPNLRFDYSVLKASKSEEGFIIDSPIVARTGIQIYRKADGSIRRELRRPEQVFSADSLASYRAKPITVEHSSGKISSKQVKDNSIGTILTDGRQDGEFVRSDIVIHQPEKMGDRRELSVGYEVELDETPGIYNGEHYDAEQINIRVNHLSVVKKGRAGAKARLNLDSDEILETEKEDEMPKIRLDNGIEYEASAEVIHALETANGKLKDVQTKLDTATASVATVTAEKDKLQARVDGLPAEIEAASKKAGETLKQRNELEKTAETFKVDCKDKTDDEIKSAVIKTFNKDFDPVGKSADYINASFDFAVAQRKDSAMQGQRTKVAGKAAEGNAREDADEIDPADAYKRSLGSNAIVKGE